MKRSKGPRKISAPGESRATAPGKALRDPALAAAKRAVPRKLHAGARAKSPAHGDADAASGLHPLTQHLLERHAGTLRDASRGDADVLFPARQDSHAGVVVQVRAGRVRRVLTRA